MEKIFDGNISILNTRKFRSLNDLKLLEELPDTKPLSVVDINGFVVYCNNAFEITFRLREGNTLHSSDSEPNISSVIENLKNSRYSNFNFEYYYHNEQTYLTSVYFVEVERVLISEREYFVLVFSSMESKLQLEEKINNLHDALEYGSVPVVITDENGNITYMTRSFEIIISKGIEYLYKCPIEEVLSDFISSAEKEELKKSINEKRPWQSTIEGKYKNEELWFKELKLSPVIKHTSTKTNYILTVHDITDLVKKEQELRKAYKEAEIMSRLKTAFLANMSHELRTPLNAIMGFIYIIEEELKDNNYESIPELFPSLKEGAERLLNMVNDVTEVSLIESGETELEIERINLNSILQQSRDKHINKVNDKNLYFELILDKKNPCIIADSKKLMRILDVLLDNSIKFTQRGTITLESVVNTKNVKLIVSDTGEGIREEMQKRILEPFAQEDEGHKRNYEGVGLGLSIAQKLTKFMNGQFHLSSEKGVGTEITLIFPVCNKL